MRIDNPTSRPRLSPLIGRISRRLLPLLLLMYVLAFLDRTNIGFAKDALQRDVGIDEAAYAFGASLFFVGYALLEVPSKPVAGAVRPAPVARADHGDVGTGRGGDGVHRQRDRLLPDPYAARHRRGGLLPRHHLTISYASIRRRRARGRSGCSTSARRSASSSAARCRACCWRWTGPPGWRAGNGCS